MHYFLSLCSVGLSIDVYELDHSDQVILLLPDQPVQVETLALCYRYKDTWVQGDWWEIMLEDGEIIDYADQIIENGKMVRAGWSFNGITSILVNEDPPNYIQLRWNNVCYMIDFQEKIGKFYHNGKLVVEGIMDGLKLMADKFRIKQVKIMQDRKAKVSDVNLITKDVTHEMLISFTSCQSSSFDGPYSWESGLWKHLDVNKTEMTMTTTEESSESLCSHESLFLILPMQMIWRGKEKCNLLSGKLYNYGNVTERDRFRSWVKSWHKKIGTKIYPGLDLSDEEEEGVWKSLESGEVIAIIEKEKPDRISEHRFEDWRPGQPNGGRAENTIVIDVYSAYDKGWCDVTYHPTVGWMTCQVLSTGKSQI